MQYSNPDKLRRAKQWAKDQGKENDEEVIKTRYIALGGLIIGDPSEVEEEADAKPKRTRKVKDNVED